MAIPNWLHLSTLSGSGDTIVTITADTLESLTARTASLVVSGNTKSVTVPVTQEAHDYKNDYLTFNITSPGVIKWTALNNDLRRTIEYKKNDDGWVSIYSSTAGTSINVTTGDVLQFKGDNASYGSVSPRRYNSFYGSTATFTAEGNVMSLIDSTWFATANTISENGALRCLFNSCTGLTDASGLVLPATNITQYCYAEMFYRCFNLTAPPKILPAMTLADYCYQSMFDMCTGMTTTPELPATTLAAYCYHDMFDGCYSLTTAPELPASVMATDCYDGMFYACSALTTAPVLSATTLEFCCYTHMFHGCSSLTTAPALPATTLSENCYEGMFHSCSSLTTAPELPAKTLTSSCYRTMFYDCTSLNYIKCLATSHTSANTFSWVHNVASAGTFVKAFGTTWGVNDNEIPVGWSVVNT